MLIPIEQRAILAEFSFFLMSGIFQVSTIDGFQGDQNDVIILSLVRCNPHGAIGFLMEQSRRCVAQSRARCAMIIIGSAATLTHSPASPWGPLVRQALLTGGNFGRETRKLIDTFLSSFVPIVKCQNQWFGSVLVSVRIRIQDFTSVLIRIQGVIPMRIRIRILSGVCCRHHSER